MAHLSMVTVDLLGLFFYSRDAAPASMRIKTVSILNGEAISDWLATSLHLSTSVHSGKKCVISKIDFSSPCLVTPGREVRRTCIQERCARWLGFWLGRIITPKLLQLGCQIEQKMAR